MTETEKAELADFAYESGLQQKLAFVFSNGLSDEEQLVNVLEILSEVSKKAKLHGLAQHAQQCAWQMTA